MQAIPDLSKSKKVSMKLWMPFLLIFALLICVIALHMQIVKMQRSDSVRINLAGRQRMLTQKLSKEVLQYSENVTLKENLEKTMNVFEATLSALANGGKAPVDLFFQKQVQLPEMENDSTRTQLSKVNDLWKVFKSNILVFANTKDQLALNYVIENNIKLLEEMDKAVFMMQRTAERNNRNINGILYVIYLTIIIIFAVLLAIKLYQLKHVSVYVDHLERILPICVSCKKIREPEAQPMEQESWTAMETYIENRSETQFSHGMCPSCIKEMYGDDVLLKLQQREKNPEQVS